MLKVWKIKLFFLAMSYLFVCAGTGGVAITIRIVHRPKPTEDGIVSSKDPRLVAALFMILSCMY